MPKFCKKFSIAMAVFAVMIFSVSPAYAAAQNTLKVLDTTAGSPALIMVSGKPFEVVELKITNPFRSTVNQKFQLNEKGILQHWYSQAVMTGTYKVAFQGKENTFFVSAGPPDATKSSFELSDYTAFVGGRIDGIVTLKDRFSNIVINRALELKSKGNAAITCTNSCVTNQKGVVKFTVQSDRAGLKKLAILDQVSGKSLFVEDLGFIPRDNTPVVRNPFQYSAASIWDESIPAFDEDDFIPLIDHKKAARNSRGNDDRYIAYAAPKSSFRYLRGQVLDPVPTVEEPMPSVSEITDVPEQTIPAEAITEAPAFENSEIAAAPITPSGKFEIVFVSDAEKEKDKKFEEVATVDANAALNFIVRATDPASLLNKSYKGVVSFELDPKGPQVPSDYTFSEIDQGMSVFELALVLPIGEYTLKAVDKDNPEMKGEVRLNAGLSGLPTINNTEIILTLDSPVDGSFYSKEISVKGTVSTDNTEITVKEGAQALKKGTVDQEKKFDFALDLQDGKRTIDIVATYLPDGSETKTSVSFEVDRTAPVITKVEAVEPSSVRAGETFTMKVEAEEGATLKAFINNRAYEFEGQGRIYTLNALAPEEHGKFAIDLNISDKFGNSETTTGASTIMVLEPLHELKNLFGIPGSASITLSWDPVEGASSYEVTHESIVGTSEVLKTSKNTITIEQLSETVNYVFTVVAKDASGNAVSLATETAALTPLEPKEEPLHTAAELPSRHTNSGPEVYVVILLSVMILNLYGKVRRAIAK